jgi:hypothetical protein
VEHHSVRARFRRPAIVGTVGAGPTLRPRLVIALTTLLLAALCAAPASASDLSHGDRSTLQRYAADTWHSFDLLVDARSGLPDDNVTADGRRGGYTSPTNIGAYLWSTLGAREVGLISRREATKRMRRTLATLARVERGPGGQFFNWYDPVTGARLTTWPADGSPLFPFLSAVDNGWLAAGLTMVENGVPELRAQAHALVSAMDFGFYYDPAVGQLRGGAWTEKPPGDADQVGDVWFTRNHYDVLNSEPRMASYLGIAGGQVPAEHYFHLNRTFSPVCPGGDFQEMQPSGVTRNYLGVDVYEGHYDYRGMHIVPSWGGDMFEALMVPLFVPEERWGPRSWGVNHPLYVRAQIEHGLDEARYGYWGFSPSDNPSGGYSAYGVDAIGMQADGYPSNNDNTFVDHGFGDCRPATPDPGWEAYTNGVVTPHASFLALRYAPRAALANLAKMRSHFGIYGKGGFYDAVNVDSGQVARSYLALDQGMVMAAAANALSGDRLRTFFVHGAIDQRIRPLLAMEQFTAG